MKNRALAFLCLFILVFSSASHATVYYLSTTGSDANNGRSTVAPWGTLQHAVSALYAGDTLYVRGGTYSGRQYFITQRSGAPDHPIVVCAYRGERPLFNGPSDPDSEGHRLWIGHSYFVFDGINSYGGWNPNEEDNYALYMDGATHVTLRNCNWTGYESSWIQTSCWYEYVWTILNSSYITMDACTVQYSGKACALEDPYLAHQEGAALVIGYATHHVVLKNSVIRFGGHDVLAIQAIDLIPPHHIIIKDNVIDANGTDEFDEGWGGGYGIGLNMATVPIDSLPQYIVIEGNRIRGGSRSYIEKGGVLIYGVVGMTFRNNLIWNCGRHGVVIQLPTLENVYKHNLFYNNTIVNSGRIGLALAYQGTNLDQTGTDNLFANNIIYSAHEHYAYSWWETDRLLHFQFPNACWDHPATFGRNIFKNNIFTPVVDADTTTFMYGCGYDGFLLGGAVQDSFPQAFINNRFMIDPDFDQYSYSGVTLREGSPCIDGGIDMRSEDFVIAHLLSTADSTWARENGIREMTWSGNAPDIGAAETNFIGFAQPPKSGATIRKPNR